MGLNLQDVKKYTTRLETLAKVSVSEGRQNEAAST